MLLESLRLDGFLSFSPNSTPIQMAPLNVVIGPNGSGKSNLIEAIELLRACSTGLSSAIRLGGGAKEWLWKGETSAVADVEPSATIEAVLSRDAQSSLRYMLQFGSQGHFTEIFDERLEETVKDDPSETDVYFYYRYQQGEPVLNVRAKRGQNGERRPLERDSLSRGESVLSHGKDSELYPELASVAKSFAKIATFREWTFGRLAAIRQPQPADLATDVLSFNSANLGLMLMEIEHGPRHLEFQRALKKFLPRFERMSTRALGGTIQFYLHESGLSTPIPATRLSDGTIRFLAMLALLMAPELPSLVCIEEPELGLHPDATTFLADLLLAAREQTQLVVTTHSDALISALSEEPETVLVCEHRGGTTLRRLEREPLKHWLEQYRLGELWKIGTLGGNP